MKREDEIKDSSMDGKKSGHILRRSEIEVADFDRLEAKLHGLTLVNTNIKSSFSM